MTLASGRFIYTVRMTTAWSRETSTRDVADVAWERRRRAAWLDYLRVVQSSERGTYTQEEQNAWEQLQRRLRRNDQLRDELAAATNASSTS